MIQEQNLEFSKNLGAEFRSTCFQGTFYWLKKSAFPHSNGSLTLKIFFFPWAVYV